MVFFLLILLYHFSLSETPVLGLIRVYRLKKKIYLEEGHHEDLHITIIPIIKHFFHIHTKRQGCIARPGSTPLVVGEFLPHIYYTIITI
jgi:hypothetical protein